MRSAEAWYCLPSAGRPRGGETEVVVVLGILRFVFTDVWTFLGTIVLIDIAAYWAYKFTRLLIGPRGGGGAP